MSGDEAPWLRQQGIITAAQARGAGLSKAAVVARLDSGRWQRICTGVYATFSGPLPYGAMLWAAVLIGGPEAALSHETAAELDGLIAPEDRWAYDLHGRSDFGPGGATGSAVAGRPAAYLRKAARGGARGRLIQVTVPHGRVVRTRIAVTGELMPRVVFHRSRAAGFRHPARLPPRTRIEWTILDLADKAVDLDRAIGWLAVGCQRRLTTPERLFAALDGRRRTRRRRELRAALSEIDTGSHTLLELRFTRGVVRAHGLPEAQRQVRRLRNGLVHYDDADYADLGVSVELDGGLAHPQWERGRDRTRDNITAEHGGVTIRYGWSDVTERPCATAAQLAAVLTRRGWTGRPHSCGRPGCPF